MSRLDMPTLTRLSFVEKLGTARNGPIADCPLLAAAPQKLAARALGSRQFPHDPVVDR